MLTDEQLAGRVVLSSLGDFFATLRNRYKGRHPNLVRAVEQGVGAAIGATVPRGWFTTIATAAGCSTSLVSNGHQRWHEWLDGERDNLVDLRGAERSDKTPKEWIEHAIERWFTNCVKSPRTKDSIRNPHNKKDKERYRVYFKEIPTYEIHADILRTGKGRFGDDYHWSAKKTREVRPFQIKPAHREVCSCIYHLRFDLFTEALYFFVGIVLFARDTHL